MITCVFSSNFSLTVRNHIAVVYELKCEVTPLQPLEAPMFCVFVLPMIIDQEQAAL